MLCQHNRKTRVVHAAKAVSAWLSDAALFRGQAGALIPRLT